MTCMDDNMEALAEQVDVIFYGDAAGISGRRLKRRTFEKTKIIDLSAGFPHHRIRQV